MKHKKHLFSALCLLTAFFLWTICVAGFQVRPIGPEGSSVGFAGLNGFVRDLVGVHMVLYTITDWLSLIPLGLMAVFALLGLSQWLRRKSLGKVDKSILALGVFYLAIMAAYLFFERFIVNYRPVLIGGVLEASYPSSTTMLVIGVMATTAIQVRQRIQSSTLRNRLLFLIFLFSAFMVIGRLLSGVHWFTDIVGGILLSTGLVQLYVAFSQKRDC